MSETESTYANSKIEAIIRTVAAKHGIALGRNDPILILYTLNELLIIDFARKQEELVQQFRMNLEEIADNWNSNMETKSAKYVGDIENQLFQRFHSLQENQIENFNLAVSQAYTEAASISRKQSLLQLKFLRSQLRNIKLLAVMNIAVSIITLLFSIAFLKAMNFV